MRLAVNINHNCAVLFSGELMRNLCEADSLRAEFYAELKIVVFFSVGCGYCELCGFADVKSPAVGNNVERRIILLACCLSVNGNMELEERDTAACININVCCSVFFCYKSIASVVIVNYVCVGRVEVSVLAEGLLLSLGHVEVIGVFLEVFLKGVLRVGFAVILRAVESAGLSESSLNLKRIS